MLEVMRIVPTATVTFLLFCSLAPTCRGRPLDGLATNAVFVALDTETTGFSSERDRIVEIGLVRFRNGDVLDTSSWLVNPGIEIPWYAKKVHGISDSMVADKPGCAAILPEVTRFIADAPLLAHNARFDLRFLESEYLRAELSPPTNACFDTLKLARKWFPESRSHSLKNLLEHLEIPPENGFHRAMADAAYLVDVFTRGIICMGKDVTLEGLIKLHGPPLKMKRKRNEE